VKQGPKRSLVGQTFSQLMVIGHHGLSKRGVRLWDCTCSCGQPHVASTGSLEHHTVQSCGCRRKQPRISQGMATDDGLLRQLLGHYRQSAARRQISFTLTETEFRHLVEQNCFYCGQAPNREYRPTRYKSSYRSNGVDRRENSQGYVLENCVPCCKDCNRFKSDLSQERMFDIVRRIYIKHLREEKA
jgi:hypothetical protein